MNPDFSKIRAFAFDVDGVFTNGGILCDLDGELFRTYDAKDGFGVRMAALKGYPIGIITGGRSGSIKARFRTCGVPEEDIYLGSRIKTEDFEDFIRRHGLEASEVAYIGDDVPDIEVIEACGIGCCPNDAVDEVKAVSDYISPYPGGRMCVRDLIEKVLRARGDWTFDSAAYKKKF